MEDNDFIHKNIEEYISYISEVKNLSENTYLSYRRDLKKLANFLMTLNITSYASIDEISSIRKIGIFG